MKKKYTILSALLCCSIAASFLVACTKDVDKVNANIDSSTEVSSSQASSTNASSNISSDASSSVSSDISSTTPSSKSTASTQTTSSVAKKSTTSSKTYTSSKTVSSQAPASSKQISSQNNTAVLTDYASVENEILKRVNDLRTSLGLSPLAKNNALTNSALTRSKEMLASGIFEHTRPDGTSFQTAIDQAGYKWSRVGENIAYCKGYSVSQLADVFFDGWKNSPGHYANMVKPEFTEIGIAIAGDGTTTYATQNFGTPQ